MSRHCITFQAARALAAYVRLTYRPDWDEQGLVKKIGEAAQMTPSPAILAAAVIAAAANPANRTPGAIAAPGPHWPAVPDGSTLAPDAPRCEDHPTLSGPTCPSCIGDVKVGDRPRAAIGKRLGPPPAGWDSWRAALAGGWRPGVPGPNPEDG